MQPVGKGKRQRWAVWNWHLTGIWWADYEQGRQKTHVQPLSWLRNPFLNLSFSVLPGLGKITEEKDSRWQERCHLFPGCTAPCTTFSTSWLPELLGDFCPEENRSGYPKWSQHKANWGLTLHWNTAISGNNSTDFNCLWTWALLLRVSRSLSDMGNFMINPVLEFARPKTLLWKSEAQMGVWESRGLRGFSASWKQNDAKKSRRNIRGKKRVIFPQGISKGCAAGLQRLTEVLPKGDAFFIKEITF